MKIKHIILKTLKWIGLSIGSLLLLIILAGLCFRIFGPKPQPPGELVDVGGFKLHINSSGKIDNKPTLILETGQGLPTEHYHWLSEGLKDSMRVVRYDRAGIGYSELSNTSRDAETIAYELHSLLERSQESPPYILAGHSWGGLFVRVFAKLYPDEVEGLVFLDSSHPDQNERMNYPPPRDASLILSSVAVLADLGVIGLAELYFGSILASHDLPEEVNNRFLEYNLNGTYLRGYRDERKWDQEICEQSRNAEHFGSLPVRVFTANKRYNGDKANPGWVELQEELAKLSTDSKHILIDGHHNSIYTTRDNADIISNEIIQLARELDRR